MLDFFTNIMRPAAAAPATPSGGGAGNMRGTFHPLPEIAGATGALTQAGHNLAMRSLAVIPALQSGNSVQTISTSVPRTFEEKLMLAQIAGAK